MSPGSSSSTQEGKQGRKETETEGPGIIVDQDIWHMILNSESRGMKNLLRSAQQKDLPQKLMSFIEDQEMESGDLSCVQLLICQTAPVLRKMQATVTNRIDGKEDFNTSNLGRSIEDGVLGLMPPIDELRSHGHECEKRFPGCDLNTIA